MVFSDIGQNVAQYFMSKKEKEENKQDESYNCSIFLPGQFSAKYRICVCGRASSIGT